MESKGQRSTMKAVGVCYSHATSKLTRSHYYLTCLTYTISRNVALYLQGDTDYDEQKDYDANNGTNTNPHPQLLLWVPCDLRSPAAALERRPEAAQLERA